MGDNVGSTSGGYSDETDHHHQGGGMMKKEVQDQTMLVPIANVGRLMKQILPANAKISKEAKETMQECVSEFICFVTGEASDKCRKERRKTLTGDDICWAMEALGLDDYSSPLRVYLHRYREFDSNDNNNNNHRAASNAAAQDRPNGSKPF